MILNHPIKKGVHDIVGCGAGEVKKVRRAERNSTKTCELVAELKTREGVEVITAEPDQKKEILVEGSAIILVISD